MVGTAYRRLRLTGAVMALAVGALTGSGAQAGPDNTSLTYEDALPRIPLGRSRRRSCASRSPGWRKIDERPTTAFNA